MVDESGINVSRSSSPSHKGPYDDGSHQFNPPKKQVRSVPIGQDALNSVGLTDTYYIYSYDGKLLAEYDHNGLVLKNYIYLGDRLLAEYNVESGSGQYYYYMSDTHRSTRLITDSTGTVVYSAAYDPYGNIQKTWTSTYNPRLKFSGKEREDYSGLDYFGARYYDSSSFRFNSVDPIITKTEAMVNPQLWNLYAYCNNNPTTYYDPDGRWVMVLQRGAEIALNPNTWKTAAKIVSAILAADIIGKLWPGKSFSDVLREKIAEAKKIRPILQEKGEKKKKRSERPIGQRKDHKTRKEAREAAQKAGKGKPIHHPHGEHGPHYHPNNGRGRPKNHDHYNYPKRYK